MGRTRSTRFASGLAGAVCALAAVAVSARPAAAQQQQAGLSLRSDVTGSLLRRETRPLLTLGDALRDPLAFDPLASAGLTVRAGRRIDWSRVPASRLLGGLLGIVAADHARLTLRTNLFGGEGRPFSAGLVSHRTAGRGVGLTWRF